MNFFEAQAQAKRHTARLVVLFALAVIGLVVIANLVVLLLVAYGSAGMVSLAPGFLAAHFDPAVCLGVTLFILLVVFLGSAFKWMALSSGGGKAVAEMLGGRPIPGNTRDFHERRLMNVVEEMAIASGIPVPPVYVLEEPGINAFAAGDSPNRAVIGVTRGALELLDRDELQGVIAHEFSHVFNGDMRLNLRLMGVLHGILLLALMGYYLLRSMRYARASRGRGGNGAAAAIPVIGLGLMVLGSVGYFFGQWIKATISRQRELLADATAVQYTRNREGIAGALKKIGGLAEGSRLQAPAAAQYSHAYFARGIGGMLQALFATHPRLEDRIRRLDPQWDGRFVTPRRDAATKAGNGAAGKSGDGERAAAAIATGAVVSGAIAAGLLDAQRIVAGVGNVGEEQVALARDIIDGIPARLREAAQEPYGARAVVYGLLFDPRPDIAEAQRAILARRADPDVARLAGELEEAFAALPERAGLALIELALPALQSLSGEQYQRFRTVVDDLIAADRRVSFREWIVKRFLIQQLDLAFGLRDAPRARHRDLAEVRPALALVLAFFAHTEHADEAQARAAFEAGAATLPGLSLAFAARADLPLRELDAAVDRLEALDAPLKARVLEACAAAVLHDGRLSIRAAELLRTLAACLDTPMPPV